MNPGLSLYHFQSCPYCARVRRALKDLDVDIELKDIHEDRAALAALVAATGRQTVPVLRIAKGDVWIPESAEIIRHLYDQFGDGRSPPLLARVNPQWVLIGVVILFAVLMSFMR